MLTSVIVIVCRKSRTRIRRLAAAGLCACFVLALTANAQPQSRDAPAEGVNVDVSECLDLETREQQIACYLARVDEAVEAREVETPARREGVSNRASSAPPVQTEPDEPAAPSQPPAPQPQATPPRESPAAAVTSVAPDESEQEIVATITSFREMEPDAYMIFLDNGQVWRQNRPKRYLLREGAEVHLRSTNWGPSYRLTDPDVGSFIQVERVR